MSEFFDKVKHEAETVLTELLAEAKLKKGDILVIGCSTSEVAGGRIGTVIDLLDEEKRAPLLKNRAVATEICHMLADRGQPDALLTALLGLGKKRDEVTVKLELLQCALRDLLLLHYSDNAEPIFFTDKEAALELCTRFTARELLAATEAVEKAIRVLAASGNIRLTLVQLMIDLTQ